MARRIREGGVGGRGGRGPAVAGAVALLAAYFALAYRSVFGAPFMADDFLILERVFESTFVSLWPPHGEVFHYWRPWSREFSVWASLSLFGVREWPLHALAGAVWLAIGGVYFALVRGLAGVAAAAAAVAGLAALAAWSAPVYWVAGLQELWLLAFVATSLLCFARGRGVAAAVALAFALLSKEPAFVVPAVALAYSLVIDRDRFTRAALRTAPLWIVTLAWAALHPRLGSLLAPRPPAFAPPWPHPSPPEMAGHAILAALNLDALPLPTAGWGAALAGGCLQMLPLAALVLWGGAAGPAGADAARERPATGRVVAFGALWAALACVPLLEPSLPWNAYYALAPALGLWLVAATVLGRHPRFAAAVVCALALVRAARTTTVSESLGSEWYQTRLAEFTRSTRAYFLAAHPAPAPHTRVYLSSVPGGAGLFPGASESVVMRVWYGEPTLRAYYASRYRPRPAGEPDGPDLLFGYDPATGWYQAPIGVLRDSIPPQERERRATLAWEARDFAAARDEMVRLAENYPENPAYAEAAGRCWLALGDSAEAARWFRRAAGPARRPPPPPGAPPPR